MSKLRLVLIFLIVACLTKVAFGQLFSFTRTDSSSSATPSNAGKITPPLSPEEFRNKVNAQAQQSQNNLMQQSLGNVKQQMGQMQLPTPAPSKKKDLPAPTDSSANTSANPPEQKSNSVEESPHTAQEASIPGVSAAQPTAQPAAPLSVPNTTPTPAAPSAAESGTSPAQGQVYTGFQSNTGNTNNTNTGNTTNQKSGGGWNIKY